MQIKNMHKTSLLKKLITCFTAGLVASVATQRIIYRTIWEFKNKWISAPVLVAIPVVIVLLVVIVYAFVWHQKEKKSPGKSAYVLAFWQGVIRYFIAIDLSMIGWQKLFHLQFSTPLGMLDEPFSSFSGEALTWAYFGRSYAFTCVIGLLQIAGSYLLLFKRTRLFGSILLFPVMLNIVLIDFFYGLDFGELSHAGILLVGILYLLLQDYDLLVEFFFRSESNLPVLIFKSRLMKIIIRISVIIIPLALIISYGSADKNPQLIGKYKIKDLRINQKQISAASCADSVLTTVYFDQGNDIVFEYNNLQRRWIGTYNFNPNNNTITATWRYPANIRDTLVATLSQTNNNQLSISGRLGNQSMKASLTKVK